MNAKRSMDILLVAAALASFFATAFYTVPAARKFEVIALAAIAATFLVAAGLVRPMLRMPRSARAGLAWGILLAGWLKNYVWPFPAAVFSFFDYSLIFSLGQALSLLAIRELFETRLHRTRQWLVLYTFLVMAVASHAEATHLFFPGLAIYTIVYILHSRVSLRGHLSFRPLLAWLAIILVLATCAGVAQVLRQYRQELNDWRPFDGQETARSGFSPITVLGSKNIANSREPVLRYFARPQVYHLRGKVFDRYEHGRWQLSQENLARLVGTPGGSGERLFFWHDQPFAASDQRLLFLTPEATTLFLPLGTVGIRVSNGDHVRVGVNQENVAWVESSIPLESVIVTVAAPDLQPLPVLPKTAMDRYTQIPDQYRHFFGVIATEMMDGRDAPDAAARAKLIVQTIKDYLAQHYPYKTQTILDPKEDPIVSFLKKRDGGHCEMFASAFIMLCRSQGVAARYVGGYYAHEWNGLSKFATVRACDAHAWAEVFIPEQGWITCDPTPEAQLQATLAEYRGVGEGYRELFAELWRRLCEMLAAIIATLGWPTASAAGAGAIIVVMVGAKWLRAKLRLRSAKNIEERQPTAPPVSLAIQRLQRLWQAFVAAGTKLGHPWPTHTTPREYFRAVYPLLTPDQQTWSKALVEILETGLYQETSPENEILESLEDDRTKIFRI